MKRLTLIIILSWLCILPACGDTGPSVGIPLVVAPIPDTPDAGGEMIINMKIMDNVYTVTLYDNAATRGFASRLPVTLQMDDFNRNEKLYRLPYSLPVITEYPSRIVSGDLMLYGANNLVLFYETFNTSYGYTKIGRVNGVAELSSIVGENSVIITFSAALERQ